MPFFPLITHDRPDAVFAYRHGRPISALQFLTDVTALAQRLPDAQHVLNACSDRYHFAVGLGACLLRGKCSVLPSTHTPEVIRQLRAFAADVICLSDDARNAIDLPQLPFPPPAAGGGPWSVPQIDRQQLAAFIFTSGSTGTPLPHRKLWGQLVASVRAEAQRILGARPHALLGTVPAQHMYGLESTVLLPLQSAGVLCAERPFYPADIIARLRELPLPRALITTPVHLRALIAAELPLPALQIVVSATAMLPAKLAREVETRTQVPLLEIYGSTETGQIASRRTVTETQWRLWPEVRLSISQQQCWAHGGHVEPATALADVLESTGDDTFLLHGRSADLVNIAGKRSSLGYLNHQLNAIAGVVDGAFFIRDDAEASLSGVTRLAAVAVAPQLEPAAILLALRERIDAVFLPRPLLLLPELPRNETGKLLHHTLNALAARAGQNATDRLA